jgi:pantoate--beta-alanine ligase
MYLFKQAASLRAYLDTIRAKGQPIGFVPTMGALHQGHLSLIRQSMESACCTVCSIFVNPTQFNHAADLEKYPRTPAKDLEMLCEVGCEVVFMPDIADVYPAGLEEEASFALGALAEGMEGRFRPGHFQGVAQVVRRLLDIVGPQYLFMGQKDYQQFAIIEYMAKNLSLPVEVRMCPTVREPNGLAMSSRNTRLSPRQQAEAAIIHQSLQAAKSMMDEGYGPSAIQEKAMQQLRIPGFEPEYFELVDGFSLQPIAQFEAAQRVVACTAVWAGEIRLIDNLILKG